MNLRSQAALLTGSCIYRLHLLELGFAVFLFVTGCYDFLYGKNNYFVYLWLQTITFFIAGFGYIGTIV